MTSWTTGVAGRSRRDELLKSTPTRHLQTRFNLTSYFVLVSCLEKQGNFEVTPPKPQEMLSTHGGAAPPPSAAACPHGTPSPVFWHGPRSPGKGACSRDHHGHEPAIWDVANTANIGKSFINCSSLIFLSCTSCIVQGPCVITLNFQSPSVKHPAKASKKVLWPEVREPPRYALQAPCTYRLWSYTQ